MKIERRKQISLEDFEKNYLIKNQPIIITDAMDNWEAKNWTPQSLNERFGNSEVLLFDNLFSYIKSLTLSDYIKQYINNKEPKKGEFVPYVRWFTQMMSNDFTWADEFFEKIQDEWSLPYFLPQNNYLIPYCPTSEKITPVKDNFLGKGFYLSAKGAKTKLHIDHFGTDGILCQIYGTKDLVIYEPSQKKFLYDSKTYECVDIENPDFKLFPNFDKAKPSFIDQLKAGEILFVPHGWLHHVDTIETSISLTWNFAHLSTWKYLFEFLVSSPPPKDIEFMRYMINYKTK